MSILEPSARWQVRASFLEAQPSFSIAWFKFGDYQLYRHGVPKSAIVRSLRWDPRSRAATHYVTFEFRVGNKGHHVSAEQQITAKHAYQLRYGQQVQIRYLPANPKIARLTDADIDNVINNTGSIIAILIMLLFPPLIVVAVLLFLYHGRHIPV